VHGSLLQRITAVAILFSLVACATVPQPPNQELAAAETAINSADQARVVDYASAELQEARTKLAAARAAVQQEKMILAQQLAEQSRVDAELALAKAEAIKAKEINDEMMKSTDVMKQEMQRNTGDKQ
jgi:serine phosphatase RsbU (regulator of sigma subunit)